MRCSGSTALRVAVALVPLMCFGGVGGGRPSPPSLSAGGGGTALSLRSGRGDGQDDIGTASRWKHKGRGGGGVGVGSGSGGFRPSQHHRGGGHAIGLSDSDLNVGMLVPKTSFGVRGYLRAIHDAMHGINKAYKKNHTMNFSKHYDFEAQNVRYRMMSLTPSPTGR